MVLHCPPRLRSQLVAEKYLSVAPLQAFLLHLYFWDKSRPLLEHLCCHGGSVENAISDPNYAGSTSEDPPFPGLLRAQKQDLIAFGSICGTAVEAFIDTGAENLVSDELVRRQGLKYTKHARERMMIADGTYIPTLGTVQLPWQFRGETDADSLHFRVISSRYVQRPVTLGGAYLWQSDSLTQRKERIAAVPRSLSSPQRLLFQGRGELRMNGICEQQQVRIFPDLASDITAMSVHAASRLGLPIDTSAAYLVKVTLPGERVVSTAGRVNNVQLHLGDHTYHEDFYLLEGMPGDIILSGDFLLRADVFQRHADLIYIEKPEYGNSKFLAVTQPRQRRFFHKNSSKALSPEQSESKQLTDNEDLYISLRLEAEEMNDHALVQRLANLYAQKGWNPRDDFPSGHIDVRQPAATASASAPQAAALSRPTLSVPTPTTSSSTDPTTTATQSSSAVSAAPNGVPVMNGHIGPGKRPSKFTSWVGKVLRPS